MKPTRRDSAEATVIPVTEEVPVLRKRRVRTGRLLVRKQVAEQDAVLDEPLQRHELRIERVPVHRIVADGDALPGVRYEGETMVVPVLREVPVVLTRVIVVEEVRITRVSEEYRDPQTVKVRVERVSIDRK